MKHKVKILMTEFVTHDVKRFVLEKPKGYKFTPGQATEVAINNPKYKDETRPFTLTSLNDDSVLEFTIKKYKGGITEKIHNLNPGEELIIDEPFGAIKYKGEGYFIAGGAGVTPFIAILKELKKEGKIRSNKLLFSNKKRNDIIFEQGFRAMLGKNLILNLTKEKKEDFIFGKINEEYIKKQIKDFSKKFYVCGPPKMVKDITKILKKLGAKPNSIVVEE